MWSIGKGASQKVWLQHKVGGGESYRREPGVGGEHWFKTPGAPVVDRTKGRRLWLWAQHW